MAAHPWVLQGTARPRFGVLVTGARGRTADGGFPMYDQPVRRMVDTARVAEDLGYDALFVGDHPTILPDPFVCLSALATATERLSLGTLVVVPSFRHPTTLARLASDVDRLSAGRLILGLGTGQVAADFNALGLSVPTMSERRRLLSETVELVEGIWSRESFSYHGQYVTAMEVRGIPPPAQSPRPPIIIAGAGERTLRQVARLADGCNLAGPWGAVTAADVREVLTRLRYACAAEQRAYDEIVRTYIAVIVIAPDTAQLETKMGQLFPREFAELRRRAGYIVAGTPQQMVPYFQERIDAGIQYFVAQLADTRDEETLHLLATQVIPLLSEHASP